MKILAAVLAHRWLARQGFDASLVVDLLWVVVAPLILATLATVVWPLLRWAATLLSWLITLLLVIVLLGHLAMLLR